MARARARRRPGAGRAPPARFDPSAVARPGSLQGLMVRYLSDLERRNYSPTTLDVRRRQLRAFARWLEERDVRDAAQVTRAMIERYQRWLFAYRRADDGRPLTVGYQIQRVKPIEMLFRWAVRKHYLPANPASDLDHPRPVKKLPDVLTVAEVDAILAVPDPETPLGLRDRALLEMLYSTGMRRSELARLRLDDVDHRHGLVRIVQGKGHKDRVVPVGDRALVWLGRYTRDARSQLLGVGTGADALCRTIFLSTRGWPLSPDNLTSLVRDHVLAAGITKPGSCHLFRHAMATALLQNGCDVRLIQELLGHTRLDTTALYTHVGVAHLKRAHTAFHPAEGCTPAPEAAGPESGA